MVLRKRHQKKLDTAVLMDENKTTNMQSTMTPMNDVDVYSGYTTI